MSQPSLIIVNNSPGITIVNSSQGVVVSDNPSNISINSNFQPISVNQSSQNIAVSCEGQEILVNQGNTVTVNTGNISALVNSFIADEPIDAFDVVVALSDRIIKADVTNPTHVGNVEGMALNSGNTGDTIDVVMSGRVTNSGFSLIPSLPIFLGLTPGSIAQDDPETVDGATFSIRIGTARSATSINLRIGDPILF